MSTFTEGQTVVVEDIRRGTAQRLEVVHVGASFVQVRDGEHWPPFSPTTRANLDASRRLYTVEEWADHERRKDLALRLKTHGLTLENTLGATPDTKTLEKVVALVEKAAR